MNIKLDYKISDLEERQKIVDAICQEHENELSPKNLETLSDYLINLMEKDERREKRILTQNRLATVNKRETSFEGLTSKFENGEDGVYQLMRSDKNMILSPAISITKKDVEELPFISQIKECISWLKEQPNKNYIMQAAIVDLSQTQYMVKNAYRKPIQFNSLTHSARVPIEWNKYLDFNNWNHIAAILKNYSKIKTTSFREIDNDMYWILQDLEDIIERNLKDSEPMLYDILVAKVEEMNNINVQKMLEEKYGKTYSIEYISSLFNNKIPKLIAEASEKEELLWHYTFVEKGEWKKCNRCGQIKLLHTKFFSKNSSSKNGFYSICKCCRNKKKGAE